MKPQYSRVLTIAAGLLAVVAVGPLTGAGGTPAPKAPTYKLANVGAFGGEPTITSNSKG